MRDRLYAGMAERGITGDVADDIVKKLEGVRRLRFPREPLGELRLPRVRELVDQAALPGGVRVRAAERAADGFLLAAHHRARRGSVTASRCWGRASQASRRDCTLEPRSEAAGPIGTPRPGWHADPSIHAMRVGLRYVRGLSRRAARPHRRRTRRAQPFTDLEDFTRRTGAPTDALEALATAGAFACFGAIPAQRAVGRRRVARRAGREAARDGHGGRCAARCRA